MYQDEILAISIGEPAARDVDEGLERVFGNRFGIQLTTTAEENKPFATTVDVIGAQYNLKNVRSIKCTPSDHTAKKYTRIVRESQWKIGSLMPKEDLQIMAGIHTFIARFFYNVDFMSNAVYACIQHTTNSDWDLKSLSREAFEELMQVKNRMHVGVYPTITRDALRWHPGGSNLL